MADGNETTTQTTAGYRNVGTPMHLVRGEDGNGENMDWFVAAATPLAAATAWQAHHEAETGDGIFEQDVIVHTLPAATPDGVVDWDMPRQTFHVAEGKEPVIVVE